ncbi:Fic family protein [Methylomonas sp. LL1]|uniref:Fic family protein n=1 Tax=Methylomonas sp. LL1 TaxID=2785785 RepID=UPI0018C3C9EB|nr:Fic family protein [Methylomonas sp. LL1]QPK62233.1 Fic family protein [Methylomonas sp. LL1]
MKIPAMPPNIQDILEASFEQDHAKAFQMMSTFQPVDEKGRYLHWDKLRHLPNPDGFSSEQWWCGIKFARSKLYQVLPLVDKYQQPFQYCITDSVQRKLHWLDRYASGSIQTENAITNPQTRSTYLVRSLIEEAINSSQLEGASTTLNVAKEMIRQQRKPSDKSEQMIFNNYRAMQFIREVKDEQLTPSIVFELQRIVTENTLDDNALAGRLRTNRDDIHVVDNASQQILHTPPDAGELEARIERLCKFANSIDDGGDNSFLHPVIKAITLHFMLAYDHPFCDGNGRTARALFYWAMARHGYWLIEFVSISRIIKEAPVQYGKAFLYTETDDNDVTYFLLHQLTVLHRSIEALHSYLDTKSKELSVTEKLFQNNKRLRGKLNFRQIALIRHALKHPRFAYIVQEHQNSHGISYDVARKDLLELSDDLKLLIKTKEGKRYLFVVPPDFEQRISK